MTQLTVQRDRRKQWLREHPDLHVVPPVSGGTGHRLDDITDRLAAAVLSEQEANLGRPLGNEIERADLGVGL